MADNVGIATGTDATVAADDIGGVLYQRVKVAVGADGAAADLAPGQAAMAASLPVAIASNQSAVPVTLGAETTKVIGTVNVAAAQTIGLAAGAAAIGKLAANSGVDIGDVDVTSIAAGDNNIGNVDIVTVPADPFGANADAASATGSLSAKLRFLAANGIAGMTTLPAGTNAIGKLAANSGVDIGDVDVLSGPTGASALQVQGTVAHDGTAANNPVLLGAEALSAERAAVATTDVTKLVADLVGKLIVLPYANPENFVSGKTAAITDTTRTAVIAAQGAGVRLYITHIIVTNSHASVGTYVKIEDDTTEIYGGYAAAAGGGFSLTLPTPLRLTANKALNVSCGTTGANVYASASGYKGA